MTAKTPFAPAILNPDDAQAVKHHLTDHRSRGTFSLFPEN